MALKKPPIQKTLPKPAYEQDMKPFEHTQMHLYLNRRDYDKAHAYYSKKPLENGTANNLGQVSWVTTKGVAHYLVGIFDGRRTTLVHELSHLIIVILDHHSIKIPDSYGEVFCYHLDNIFMACAPLFRKN